MQTDLARAEALVGTSWPSHAGTRTVVGVRQMPEGIRLEVTVGSGRFVELVPLERLDKDRAFDEESARQAARNAEREAAARAAKDANNARFDALTQGFLSTRPEGIARSRTEVLLRRPLWLKGDHNWKPGEAGVDTIARLLDEGCTVATDKSPVTKAERYILRRRGGTFWVIPKTFGLFANWYLTHRAEERPTS